MDMVEDRLGVDNFAHISLWVRLASSSRPKVNKLVQNDRFPGFVRKDDEAAKASFETGSLTYSLAVAPHYRCWSDRIYATAPEVNLFFEDR